VDTYWKSTAVVSNSSSKSDNLTIQSFITASSLAEEYLDAIVQVTSDGIPVVYPYWYLPFESFPVYIASVTYAHAKSLFIKSKGSSYKGNSYHAAVTDGSQTQGSSALAAVIYDSFLTLEELLQVYLLFNI
jgi:CDK inhibitor PHO81